jgi:hypothetical protein
MHTRRQRWLAFYTLAFPHAQAMLGIYMPLALLMLFVLRAPVLVAMVTYLPVLLLVAHFIVAVVGLYEFTEAHHLKAKPRTVVKMALTWIPYQFVLAYAAFRALRRQLAGRGEWEKTQHVGAHRVVKEAADHVS